MLLDWGQEATRKHDWFHGCGRGSYLQIGMVVVTLDVKDHGAVATFLRCADIKVQPAGATPMC